VGANKLGYVDLRLAPSDGKNKPVIEVRDPTPPARKILINCTPHQGLSSTLSKLKSKSLKINLLETVVKHNGEQQTTEVKMNMYRMTCDTGAKRDQLEIALKGLK